MRWRGVLAGFVAGILAFPLAAWLYVELGFAPVAAADPPLPFEKYYARAALRQRIGSGAPKSSPIAAGEADLLAGAKTYREDCAVCHGLPGRSETAIGHGMFPEPPQLFEGKGVTDDPVGQTYWVVKNGIRLSGMPSFGKAFRDDQLWQVSALLANAHHLPATVQRELEQSGESTAGVQH